MHPLVVPGGHAVVVDGRFGGHFPTEQAALKVRYLIAIRSCPGRIDLHGKIRDWSKILNVL